VPDASLGLQVFLMQMRVVLEDQRHVRFVERDKNIETLERYRLTVQDVYKRLAKLGPEQYREGPESDDDGTEGSVWEFSHDEGGVPIYVKLKLYVIGDSDRLKIISFHD
jgi:hypothetical protein